MELTIDMHPRSWIFGTEWDASPMLIGVKSSGRHELGSWRRLSVCSVETPLDAKTGLDTDVEAAGRSASATKVARRGLILTPMSPVASRPQPRGARLTSEALFDGPPGGILGQNYPANPRRFAGVPFSGPAEKPADPVARALVPRFFTGPEGAHHA